MFFSSWQSLLRVLVVGVLAYVGLIFLLRMSGKRTLSKMNAFDFIVTVAMGSTLATVLLSKQVALLEGILAFALLIGLQYAATWTAVRSDRFQSLIKARPRLLAHKGRIFDEALIEERVSREELKAALREQGLPGVGAAEAVILETDGTMSVVPMMDDADFSALDTVGGMPETPGPR